MEDKVCIGALYHFAPITDLPVFISSARSKGAELNLKGSLLVAPEGVNGTLSGVEAELDEFVEFLATELKTTLTVKKSYAKDHPFRRFKVRKKAEIVTFRQDVSPRDRVGRYVAPEKWNEVIDAPNTVLIDTRNDYEIHAGRFRGALDPNTVTFTEFADFVDRELEGDKDKTIAMYCTGGIRCEKATSYLLDNGFQDVVHLEGGILRYLEEVPKESSYWQGECFVFDYRVTVNHDLEPGSFAMCHVCGWPLDEEDRKSPDYERGVSCGHCRHTRTEAGRERARERQKQIELADKSGKKHLAPES